MIIISKTRCKLQHLDFVDGGLGKLFLATSLSVLSSFPAVDADKGAPPFLGFTSATAAAAPVVELAEVRDC